LREGGREGGRKEGDREFLIEEGGRECVFLKERERIQDVFR
jgi:hypothetical protein